MHNTRDLSTLGIVVPVYNDWNNLQKCLGALSILEYPKELLKIRIIDNGSNDWPKEVKLRSDIEVIRYDIPGSYGARNRAAKGWDVDVLAFTDSDCQPEINWAREGIKNIVKTRYRSIVAGKIILTTKEKYPSFAEQYDQILGFDQERTVRRSSYGATANLFIPSNIFEQLGGFNEETMSGGDRDFCERANKEGIQIAYTSQAIVKHPARNFKELAKKQKRIVGGKISLNKPIRCGKLKALYTSLKPLASESYRIIRSKKVSLLRKPAILLIAVIIRILTVIEWIRLCILGRRALR